METLFDSYDRKYDGPSLYSEPIFLYINRSSREHYKNTRETLEEWYTEYKNLHPKDSNELRERFRSTNNQEHFSALTELYIHHLLLVNGYKDIKLHPDLPNTKKHPDFLVLKDSKPLFYIESTIVYGHPNKKRQELFENSILDLVDEIHSQDFLVHIDFVKSDSTNHPKLSLIKKGLVDYLSKLNYEELANKEREEEKLVPTWTYKENDWEIIFSASPVKKEAHFYRTKDSRNIGTIMHPVKQIKLDETIRKVILGKAQKYGDVGAPFVIALNIIDESLFCDDYTIMSSFFGQETVTITSYSNGTTSSKAGRNHIGALMNKGGPRYTRISGLLILNGLSDSVVDSLTPVIWHNPFTKNPLSTSALKINQKIYNHQKDHMEDL